eukprot:3835904-Amphidinium_carterae.1
MEHPQNAFPFPRENSQRCGKIMWRKVDHSCVTKAWCLMQRGDVAKVAQASSPDQGHGRNWAIEGRPGSTFR